MVPISQAMLQWGVCRRRSLVSLIIAAGGLAACGDSFAPAQPVPGHILFEWQGTVPTGGIHLGSLRSPPIPGFFPASGLFVPGNAVTAGTTLTVRLLSPISKTAPSGWPVPPFGGEVMQVLPEGRAFAQPLVYSAPVSTAPQVGNRTTINHMFRASVDDAAWTWSSFADAGGPEDSGRPLTWAIDRPGLWILGDAPSTLQGTYRLSRVLCSVGPSTTPMGVYLTVTGDRYALTAAEPACHDEGVVSSPFSLTTGARVIGFEAAVAGVSLQLKSVGDFLGSCAGGNGGTFVLFLEFAGCSTDADCGAGGQCNGQLCGPVASGATGSCLTNVEEKAPAGK